MDTAATNSSLDVAYWFVYRAEKDKIYLETEKLQHLLFASQNRFALEHHHEMFMPCVFLCDEQGFYEPTLRKIFSQGRPFMPPVQFNTNITDFLEKIWQEYKSLSLSQCLKMIKNSSLYLTCCQKSPSSVITWSTLKNFSIDNSEASVSPSSFKKKILVSQNGPVVVSQWTPRKITK